MDWGHSIVMWRPMSERPPGDAAAAVAGDPLTGRVIVRVGPAAAAASNSSAPLLNSFQESPHKPLELLV